jgi:hypothetical protein
MHWKLSGDFSGKIDQAVAAMSHIFPYDLQQSKIKFQRL